MGARYMQTSRTAFALLVLGAAVVLAATGAAAQAVAQGCPIGGYTIASCPSTSDSVIRNAVLSRLSGSVIAQGSAANVQVQNGVVTLTGEVDSPARQEMAMILAASVRGVRRVENRLALSPAVQADISLMGRVRHALSELSGDYSNVRVDTNNGAVQLSGSVTSDRDAGIATGTISALPGVAAVYNNMFVRGPLERV